MTRILVVLTLLVGTARAGTITGRVVENGFRVAEYGVFIAGLKTPPTLVRDGDGQFTLRDVPPGMRQLVLVGWAFERKIIYVDVPTDNLALGTIEVEPGRELRGTVVDASGALVADATVLVYETRPVDLGVSAVELMAEGAQIATTRYDGTFTVQGLPDDADAQLRVFAFGDDLISVEQELGRNTHQVELAIGKLGTITGKVTNRRRMQNPVVIAKPAGVDGKPKLAGVDPAGNFSIELPAGVYDLTFPDEVAAPLQVVVVEDRTRVVTMTAPTAHATLAVRAPDCTYIRLLGARPRSSNPRTEIGFETCSEGRAQFEHLPPGPYRVCVDTDEESPCKPVTVRAAPAKQSVRIALPHDTR